MAYLVLSYLCTLFGVLRIDDGPGARTMKQSTKPGEKHKRSRRDVEERPWFCRQSAQ